MSNHHLVSIGMPVFNCAGTVAQAICSILNQTFEDWELLVIDDGSTDNTLEIAASFDDPRIIVNRREENMGLPARLNESVAMAKGRYFARMDGDDIAYPNRLQHQLDFLQNRADVDLVGGAIIVFRSDGTALGVRYGETTHEQICTNPWSGIPMAHPTWMGRTDWFRRNPYNADMALMEDWELLFRTYRHSRFANLPEIVLGYREDSLSLRKILVARRHKCRAMLRSAWEDPTRWHAASGIAGQIARSLVEIAAIGLNLNYLVLRHRIPPVSSEEIAVWHELLDKMRGKVVKQIVLHKAVAL